jgi:hypothetical protein
MRKAGTMLPVAIGIIFMVCLIGINTEQKAEAAHFSDTVTVRVNFPALVVGKVKLTVTDLDSGHFQWKRFEHGPLDRNSQVYSFRISDPTGDTLRACLYVYSSGYQFCSQTKVNNSNNGSVIYLNAAGQSIHSQQPAARSSIPPSSELQLQQAAAIEDLNPATMMFLLFLVVIIIVGVITWRLKHRRGIYNKARHVFPNSVKEKVLEKQHHKCANCNRLLNVVNYDHKNGDRSNNKVSNCQALCPNCHAIKTYGKSSH